jgi:Spx/MgsR family transcriptional regulator
MFAYKVDRNDYGASDKQHSTLTNNHQIPSMYTLYAIPNCDTVKKARAWLAENDIDYQFYDYKKQGIDRLTLVRWLTQMPWTQLVNQNGQTWRKLPETERPADAEDAIALMLEKPSVIRRPLIEQNGRVVALGFSEDKYMEAFV